MSKIKKTLPSQLKEPYLIITSSREFQDIQLRARSVIKQEKDYIKEVNEKFKFPTALQWVLPYIITADPKHNENFSNMFSDATQVDSFIDPDTNRQIWRIIVYPESSEKGVLRAYSNIKDRYREIGFTTKSKGLQRLQIAILAHKMKEDGKTFEEISTAIFENFRKNLLKNEIQARIKELLDKQKKYRRI